MNVYDLLTPQLLQGNRLQIIEFKGQKVHKCSLGKIIFVKNQVHSILLDRVLLQVIPRYFQDPLLSSIHVSPSLFSVTYISHFKRLPRTPCALMRIPTNAQSMGHFFFHEFNDQTQ